MTLDEKLGELEAKARAATPGPWRSDGCGDVWTEAEKEYCPGLDQEIFRNIGTTKRGPDRGDAAYIAALAPETVLALIAVARLEHRSGYRPPGMDDALDDLTRALGGEP